MAIESMKHAHIARRRWIALIGLALLAGACSTTAIDPGPIAPVRCAATYPHDRVGSIEGGDGAIIGLAASRTHDGVAWLAQAGAQGPEILGITPTGRPISGLFLDGLLNVANNVTVGSSNTGVPSLYVVGSADDRGNEPRLIRIDEIDPFAAAVEPTARAFELAMPNESKPVALAYDDASRELLIVGQDRARTLITRLRTPSDSSGMLEPETVARIDTGVWPIRDIDVSPDGRQIAMRTRNQLWLWSRAPGQTIIDALPSSACVSSLPSEGQGATFATAGGEIEYLAVATTGTRELRRHRPTYGEVGDPGWRSVSEVIDIRPEITVTSPEPSLRWRAGETIPLAFAADDDRPIQAQNVSWTIEEQRCIEDDRCEFFDVAAGEIGEFSTPVTASGASLIRVSVAYTDAAGLRATDSVDLLPDLVTLRFESQPPGATILLESIPITTPAEIDRVRNSKLVLRAAPIQEIDGIYYDVTVDSEITATETVQPQIDVRRLPWGFLEFSGEAGTFASRRVTVNEDALNTVDLRAFVALDDWTPAIRQGVLGANASRLALLVDPDGKLRGRTVVGNEILEMVSTEAVSEEGRLWIRFVFDFDSGDTTFYTSTDDSNDHRLVQWEQLGTTVTAERTGILSPTSVLVLGQQNAGSGRPLTGSLFAAAFLFNTSEISLDLTSTVSLSSRPPNYARWGAWTLEGDGWTYIPPPN